MTSIRSVWAATPPVINGQAESTEWADGGWLDLPHTKVFFKNDAENLYILLDVLGCNVADGEEYFGIVVDVDRSKSVTPYTDVRFGAIHQYKGDLYRKLYTQPAVGGSVQDLTTTSEMATGFYSSFNSGTAHRIWELALNLEEIGADPTTWWGSDDRPPVVRVGVWVRSSPHISGWRDEGPFHWASPGMLIRVGKATAELRSLFALTEPYPRRGEMIKCEATLHGLARSEGLTLEFWAASPSGEFENLSTIQTAELSAGQEVRYAAEVTPEEEGLYTIYAYLYDDGRRIGYQVEHVSVK